MAEETLNLNFGIKVSVVNIESLRRILSKGNNQLLKFNRYSPRLADENYSVQTISKQIIEIDKILKENKLELNQYDRVKKCGTTYPCARDIRSVRRADMRMKIMDQHNYYVEDVLNPEDYGVNVNEGQPGFMSKFYDRISHMLQ
jgi:hypothetical protein